MKKRRVLSIILTSIMLLTCCFNTTIGHVHATGTNPTIVVSDAKAQEGSTAAVSISLDNNPGIVSMTLHMTYDAESLTLTEVKDAGVFGTTFHKPEKQSPYTLVWANDTAETNFTVTGKIVTLFFDISETVEEGTSIPIEISYDNNLHEIMDVKGQTVDFDIKNGSVTVGEPGPNEIDDFTYTTSGTEMTITGYAGVARDVTIGSKYNVGGVEYTVTAIEEFAFSENADITSVVIPETVKTIGDYAFYDCVSLTEVTVLSEDATIGEGALGFYFINKKTDGIVEGFTIKGYTGSTAEEYANAEEEITFVALPKVCHHTGGTATCKDLAVCTACGESYGTKNPDNHVGGTEVRDAVTEKCNTPGYTGDTYCLGCQTKIADGEPIEATGNHVDADDKWETNGTQHFHTCGCGTEFDHANHSGGEATCKNKAACSVCGTAYGDLNANNHKGTTYLVGQKEASCYEEGYTGDTYCSDCDTKIGTGTTIKMNDHNPASVWSTDETHHWKNCETIGCGNLIDKAEHTGGEATCTTRAVCSVCNVAYGSVNANNHKNTETRDAAEPSCNTPGYTGDTWCKDCNTKIETGTSIDATGNHVDADNDWESNGTQHFHTCGCGTEFDHANHTGGTATCKDKAVCETCGTSYGDLNANNHAGGTEVRGAYTPSCNEPGFTGDTYCLGCQTKIADGEPIEATGDHVDADNKWESNGTQHFHTCGCGTEFDHANHSGGEATCKNKAACSVCGTSYGDLNANNHKGTTYLVGQKEASCYEEGYTGDTYCSDCDTKIGTGTKIEMDDHNPASVWSTDETHHWKNCETIGCGNLIDKAEHTGGEATCTSRAVCSVCNVAYGSVNANNHKNTEIRDAAEPSCNAPGYTGDTWCKDCNTKIETGTSIDATGNHVDADNDWESNGTQHYHTCGCGTEFDYADHIGGTATCKDKAACEICGTSYGDLNANKHAGGTEVRGAYAPSCSEPGFTGDTYCLGCQTKIADGELIEATGDHVDADGKWESNGTQHFHTCGCGTEFDHANHSGGEATCKNKAACSVCGTAYGDLNANNHRGTTYLVGQKEASCYEEGYTGDTYCSDCDTKIETGTTIKVNDHNPASVWSTDETHHWKNCETIGCGNLIDKAEHTGGEATCTSRAVCSVCNVAYGSVNANNHKNTEIRDAAEPSCNAPGYTGDTWCKDCNTKIETGTSLDATGNHVDADNDWESNGTQHFHTCECGTEFDHSDHTGGTATCKDKAACTACGTSYGDKNPTKHIGDTYLVDKKASSCKETGYTGDTYCSGCDTKLSDGESIDKVPHVVNEWNISKNATVDECGEKTGTCIECETIITVTTAKLVPEIREENIEGVKAEVESVGNTNISEDVHFIAKEILNSIDNNEKIKVEKAITKLIGSDTKFKPAAIFDLKLMLREIASNGDLIRETELDLDGTVKVTIPVPTEVFEKLTDIKLVHIKDDGEAEFIPFTLADGKATFEAKEFSYYTFIGTEKVVAGDSAIGNDITDSPQTGDNGNMLLWIALLFVSGACFTTHVALRKRMKQSR